VRHGTVRAARSTPARLERLALKSWASRRDARQRQVDHRVDLASLDRLALGRPLDLDDLAARRRHHVEVDARRESSR
jgi:hypothetical protein